MVHVYDDGEAADRVPSVDRVSKDLEDFCSSSRRNAPATASGGSNLRITQCDAMGDDDSEAAAATQRSNPDPKWHKMTARKSTNGIAPPRRQLATWTPAQMEHMRRGGKIHVVEDDFGNLHRASRTTMGATTAGMLDGRVRVLATKSIYK